MKNTEWARKRANLVAGKYFDVGSDWPKEKLIEELERVAYRLASEGDTGEARSLFVAVADLSKEVAH
ncbi:hypothetical protein [uncultured Roseobacter sp.]|uniref:hypothetical protein n=1 Tax=uncultured Roseobacter sp. TaxID=114847 RepID=UPI00260456C6|nr:hypothetical protein [uncultured Roseobacter sp.]